MKVDMKSLDKLMKKLKKLDISKQVPVQELFTPEFMAKHTQFSTFEEMLKKAAADNGIVSKLGNALKKELGLK